MWGLLEHNEEGVEEGPDDNNNVLWNPDLDNKLSALQDQLLSTNQITTDSEDFPDLLLETYARDIGGHQESKATLACRLKTKVQENFKTENLLKGYICFKDWSGAMSKSFFETLAESNRLFLSLAQPKPDRFVYLLEKWLVVNPGSAETVKSLRMRLHCLKMSKDKIRHLLESI